MKPLRLIHYYLRKVKVKIENFLINSFNNHTYHYFKTCYCFWSVTWMRYDLTINEFKRGFFKKYLEIYDPETNRPYCHVNDFAKIISLIVEEQDSVTNGNINAG